MTKTEKLTDLVDQASNKNPLMAAGLIKQAAGLSADILSEHERRLETAAGAVGQLAGAVNSARDDIQKLFAVALDLVGQLKQQRKLLAELAARSGMAAHFAEATAPGVIVEGEYTNG